MVVVQYNTPQATETIPRPYVPISQVSYTIPIVRVPIYIELPVIPAAVYLLGDGFQYALDGFRVEDRHVEAARVRGTISNELNKIRFQFGTNESRSTRRRRRNRRRVRATQRCKNANELRNTTHTHTQTHTHTRARALQSTDQRNNHL